MVKKTAGTFMKQPMPNTFAQKRIIVLRDWWNKYGNEFVGQNVTMSIKHNLTLPLLQREYANSGQLAGCPRTSIPFLEITPLYRVAQNGLLFVNCNPSGTDYTHYKSTNNNPPADCFLYDKQGNSYFNAVEEFAENLLGKGYNNYAMIDAFPIVMQNQAVIKKVFSDAYSLKNNRFNAFEELISMFVETVEQIQPKIIIVTNAFVKDLFTDKNNRLRLKNVPKMEKDNVCYRIETSNGLKSTVFCGGMIAGGHQMDTESKERMIRDIKDYLNKHP